MHTTRAGLARLFRRVLPLLAALMPVWAAPVLAHEVGDRTPAVIDTDLGLDDAVALAMALQHPDLHLVSIVACEGVAGRERATEHAERILDLFNRRDIALYAPAVIDRAQPVPPFRSFAEAAVRAAVPEETEPFHRRFAATAYASKGGKTVVFALGPLTNLAAALEARPALRGEILQVIVAGPADPAKSWNLAYDAEALSVVQASGIPLAFVAPGQRAAKPDAWRSGELNIGPGTSVGERFFLRVLADPRVRDHYVRTFGAFHDELALVYYTDPPLFTPIGGIAVFTPRSHETLVPAVQRLLGEGRQRKARVVLIPGTLPDTILQEDLRARKAAIIAAHGQTEWFAQLMLNELHQHLGAYSIIGVKMGLRAAELLNAPQHAMTVVSHTAAGPPVSCLNDGVIVATGCTPGRRLFRHEPGPAGSTDVSFTYNNRTLTLRVRDDYRRKVAAGIRALLAEHTLEDHEYWHGVRRLGLDIWERWHRRDLFEVIARSQTASR